MKKNLVEWRIFAKFAVKTAVSAKNKNNMNATISMDGLWAIVDSLSTKNKKWLSDRLIVSLSAPSKQREKEILNGISKSIQEAKSGKTQSLDTLWDQL